jgi:hypothetical protein
VAAELKAVVDFYRYEMTTGEWGQWKEVAGDAKVESKTARLGFSGPAGSLIVNLRSDGKEVAITLASRDAQAARAAGLSPAPGKARLIVGNASGKDAVITINNREYRIAAGAGEKDPKTGINWDVAPGVFKVEIKQAGDKPQSEELKIGPDEIWGVIIGPTGSFLATQVY